MEIGGCTSYLQILGLSVPLSLPLSLYAGFGSRSWLGPEQKFGGLKI